MFKKLLTLAAAGIIGCTAASCGKEIKKEVPAVVTLEDVYYHEFEPNVPTCLYKNGVYSGSSDEPRENSFALQLRVRINDPNMVLYEKVEWGGYESRPFPHPKKKEESTNGFGILGTKKTSYEKSPFIVEVADYQGNVTRHEFILDQLIKQSKPFIVRKKTSEECPYSIK